MTEFNWLHLTDLHMGVEGSNHLWPAVQEEFFSDLLFLFEQQMKSLDLVLFTGDLTQSGDPRQFEAVERLLAEWWERLDRIGLRPKLAAIPGNHDLRRMEPPDAAIQWLTSGYENDPDLRRSLWEQPGSEYRKVLDNAFAGYSDWWAKTAIPKLETRPGMLPGDFTASVENGGVRLGILGLNSTFLQLKGGDLKGKLAIDVRQFDAAAGGNRVTWLNSHQLCLLLTHQPPDWMSQRAREMLVADIYGKPERFALHLFGHMHETKVSSREEGLGARRQLQGCSLFSVEQWDELGTPRTYGYSLGQLSVTESEAFLRIWPRKAEKKEGTGWTIDRESGLLEKGKESTRPFPVKLWTVRSPVRPPDRLVTSQPFGTVPGRASQAAAVALAPRPPATAAFQASLIERGTKFAGRPELIRDLEQRLRQPGTRKVALFGPEGVGKSQLALHAAADLARENAFPGGVYVAGLERAEGAVDSHRDAHVRENLFAVAKAMGVLDAPRTSSDQGITNEFIKERIRARLETSADPALFVINDSSGPEQTAEFNFGGAASVYLLVTRSGRDAREFAGLENSIEVRPLRTGEAAELLSSFEPRFAQEDRAGLEALVAWLGSDPYTITHLGNWLTGERARGRRPGVSDLAAALERESAAAAALEVSAAGRVRQGSVPTGLAGVLALIEGSLDAGTRDAFRILCLFPPYPSTFSRDAASYVLGGDPKPVEALLEARLLRPGPGTPGFLEPPRYTFDAAVGLYGSRAAAASLGERRDAARRRFVEYFAGLAGKRSRNRTTMEQERQNIEEAVLTAVALGMADAAVSLTQSVAPYLMAEGLFESARNVLGKARQASHSAGLAEQEAGIVLRLGKLALASGSYSEAEEALQSGLGIPGISPECRIDLLSVLGWARDRNADNAGAISSLEEASRLSAATDDPIRRCDVLRALGWAYAHRGDLETALGHWRTGYGEINRTSADESEKQECYLLTYIGWAQDRLGEVQDAEQIFAQALPAARRLGSKPWCVAMTNMGAAAIHRGEYARAEQFLTAGLEIALRAATPNEVSILYENLGIVAVRRGDDSRAECMLSSGLRHGASSGDPERTAAILTYLAELRIWQAGEEPQTDSRPARFADAERYLLVALDQGRKTGNPERIAMALLGSARLATCLNRLPENERDSISAGLAGGMSRLCDAERHLDRGLALANRLKYLWLLLAMRLARGEFHRAIGATERAWEDFECVRSQAEQKGLADLLGLALLGEWSIEPAEEKRLDLLRRGRALLETIGHRAARNVPRQ